MSPPVRWAELWLGICRIRARAALSDVPAPALVIVQTIDNDIMCDGCDAAHVPGFGEAVAEALRIVNDASPRSKILVVGQPGRPTVAGVEAEAKRDPEMKAETTGVGPCDFLDPNGKINASHVNRLRKIIEGYEKERQACAQPLRSAARIRESRRSL